MMFELELRRRAGSEFRLTPEPMNLGDEIDLEGTRWRVAEIARPHGELAAIVRYVCVDLRAESVQLRGHSKGLVASSNGLRAISDRLRRRLG
jgi:hypothetical protein